MPKRSKSKIEEIPQSTRVLRSATKVTGATSATATTPSRVGRGRRGRPKKDDDPEMDKDAAMTSSVTKDEVLDQKPADDGIVVVLNYEDEPPPRLGGVTAAFSAAKSPSGSDDDRPQEAVADAIESQAKEEDESKKKSLFRSTDEDEVCVVDRSVDSANLLTTKKLKELIPSTAFKFDPKDFLEDQRSTTKQQPMSDTLHIRGLVRPFTVGQLKSELNRYSPIVESDFWIDRIKSHCFVRYQTVDEADFVRSRLHKYRWPASSPQLLRVDFAMPGDREHYAANDEKNAEPERRVQIREWDIPKLRNEQEVAKKTTPPPPPQITESPPRKRDKDGYVLDKLFRKTTAKPSIYWLPLSSKDVEAKKVLPPPKMNRRDRPYRRRSISPPKRNYHQDRRNRF